MEYQELVVEVGGGRYTQQIPTEQPVIIKAYLQSDSGREVSPITRIHVVCLNNNDLVMTARPNGKIGIEPTDE